MISCPKCQATFPDGTGFCPNCGTEPGAPAKSRTWKVVAIVGGALALLVVVWGFTSSGLLNASAGTAPSALTATGSTGPRVLGASGSIDSNALAAQGELGTDSLAVTAELPPPSTQIVAGQMPKELSDWLDHLLRTHNRLRGLNRTLSGQHSGSGSSLAPGVYPEDLSDAAASDDARRRGQAGDILTSVNEFFVSLDRDFRSVPPPPECAPMAQLYGAALRDIPVMVSELFQAVQELDLAKAESVGTRHRPLVEGRISETNRLVRELCDRYGVPNRWRLVEDTDYGMGGMLGAGGLGLSGEALKEYGDLIKDLLDDN